MEFNFAKKQVARISRNKIILMLVIAVGISAIILLCAPSPAKLYFGKSTFDTAEEAEKLLGTKNNFVNVTAELLFDTGYEYTEDGKTKGKYYAFWIEDTCIICKMDTSLKQDEYENYELSGKLIKATGIEAEVVSAIKEEASEYIDSSQIANFIIETRDSQIGT